MSKKVQRPTQITDMRRLRLKEGDILVVKENIAPDPDARSEFISAVTRTVGKRILVVFADTLSAVKRVEIVQILKFIGPDKMREAGWLHRSDMVRLSEAEIRAAGWVRPEEMLNEDD